MSDVEVIDCTARPGVGHQSSQFRTLGLSQLSQLSQMSRTPQLSRMPQSQCIVPVALTMHDVWCGSSHEVCVEDGSRRITRIVKAPRGIPHGQEMQVDGTVLVLRFQRDDSVERRDAVGRYSVQLDGDDVVYRVDVDEVEQKAGFTRDLSVVHEDEEQGGVRAHLRIKCAGGRACAERPMRFQGRGLAGPGTATVRFTLTSRGL